MMYSVLPTCSILRVLKMQHLLPVSDPTVTNLVAYNNDNHQSPSRHISPSISLGLRTVRCNNHSHQISPSSFTPTKNNHSISNLIHNTQTGGCYRSVMYTSQLSIRRCCTTSQPNAVNGQTVDMQLQEPVTPHLNCTRLEEFRPMRSASAAPMPHPCKTC